MRTLGFLATAIGALALLALNDRLERLSRRLDEQESQSKRRSRFLDELIGDEKRPSAGAS